MRLVASRRHRPTEDPIFSLNREATAQRAAGKSVVNATLGAIMDDAGKLSVLPAAVEALKQIDGVTWSAYAPIAGPAPFLRAVREDLLSTVPSLLDTSVAVATPGGSGALHHALITFLDEGQAVLTSDYYWSPYSTLADETGRKLATFRLFDAEGNFDVASLDQSVGELMATQGRVLLFINDPCHNPTGFSMSQDEWRQVAACLLEHAKRGPLTLLVDTAYMVYSPGNPRAFLQELVPLAAHANLAFAWSASKTFTMYGLRVGALIVAVPDEAERRATEAALTYSCRGTWSNCNHGGIVAITRLLSEPGLRDTVIAEREALKQVLFDRVGRFNELSKPRGLRYPRYEGGFFVTVFTDGDVQEKAARMRAQGVFVVPQSGALRTALCSVAERDIPRLVDALADA